MKNKYFIREMPCYTKATSEQRQRIPPGAFYYLKALPTEGLRNEFYDFLKKIGREVAATTMYSEVWRYDAVARSWQNEQREYKACRKENRMCG